MNQLKRKSEVLDSPILRTTKKMCTTNEEATIESLPRDLLMEITAKVASSSFKDLFNLKLVTKDFHQISKEGYIYQHMSLQDFPRISMTNSLQFWLLVDHCNRHGNKESLYKKGIADFFSLPKKESGLANLKASAEKGLPEACYVYGVVLYSDNSKDEGVKFLKKCEEKLGVDKMADCRRRVKVFLWSSWNRKEINYFDDEIKSNCLNKGNCGINPRRINAWDWNDEDNYYGEHTCEACKWSGEVMRFCNMLRTGRYS